MSLNVRTVVDALPQLIWALDGQFGSTFQNGRWLAFTGLDPLRSSAGGWLAAVHPDDVSAFTQIRDGAVRPSDLGMHVRLRRSDGEYAAFVVHLASMGAGRDSSGEWCATAVQSGVAAGGLHDNLRRAEALLAGEVRLLEMVALGKPLLDVLDALSRLVEELCSGCFCSILLVAPDRAHFTVGAGPSLPDSYNAILNGKTIDGGYGPCSLAVVQKTPIISADLCSDPRWSVSAWPSLMKGYDYASCWSMPILSATGDVSGIFAIYRREPVGPTPDEQELIERFTKIAGIAVNRAHADEALRASKENLRQAHAQLSEGQHLSKTGSFTADIQQDTHQWSDEFYRILEIEPSVQPSVQAVRGRVHPEDISEFDRQMDRALDGMDADFTFRIVTPAAGLKYLRGLARVIEHIDGRPIFMGTIQDVTESKSAEQALRASESELRQTNHFLTVAQSLSKTGSFTWNIDTGETHWSDEMYRIYELTPRTAPLPRLVLGIVHADDVAVFEELTQQARHGRSFQGEYRIVTDSGVEKNLYVVGHPIPDPGSPRTIVGAVQDVTELRRGKEALNKVQAELARVSRITTLSALAASIAHEVSQPLSGILTNAGTCLQMLAADPPNIAGAAATARRTIRDTDRATEVIKRLRTLFARKRAAMEPVDLNEATREVIALSASELKRQRIVLQVSLADDLPVFQGDRVQLQQVVLNLILNAADAMAEVEGRPRRLVVDTALGDENDIVLSVRDAGVGIDQGLLDKVFDPFFSTKPDGMGVGLAISRSIIEAHDGRLWAVENDGPGATFRFAIPASPVATSAAQDHVRLSARRASNGGGVRSA